MKAKMLKENRMLKLKGTGEISTTMNQVKGLIDGKAERNMESNFLYFSSRWERTLFDVWFISRIKV